MEKAIFSHSSYKSVMSAKLGSEGQRGQITRAAEALGCQRSYLSRVISGDLHLTPDHAFQLSRFWSLNDDESEYFQTLVDFERAGNPDFRAHLKSKLAALRKKFESIGERTERKHLSIDAIQAQYFSSWVWGAVHFLTCVPKFQTPAAIAHRLGLQEAMVRMVLQEMKSRGLVAESRDRWNYQSGEFHIDKSSPLAVFHHQNWRQRATLDAQNPGNGNVHFTGVLTMSQEDSEKIKELLLQFIAKANAISSPSKPEDALALTCDFFPV